MCQRIRGGGGKRRMRMLIAKIRKNMTKTRTRSKLRRILPTYLPQQCLHLVGVTLNREQQIRVAEEEEEAAKVKTHTLVTSLHADCQISADCTIQHDTVCIDYRQPGFRLYCFAH